MKQKKTVRQLPNRFLLLHMGRVFRKIAYAALKH